MRFWFRSATRAREEERAKAAVLPPEEEASVAEDLEDPALAEDDFARDFPEIDDTVEDIFEDDAIAGEIMAPEIGSELEEIEDELDALEDVVLQPVPEIKIEPDSPRPTVSANELPSAADRLAELFPEEQPEQAEIQPTAIEAPPAETLEQEDEEILESSQQSPVNFSAEDIEKELRSDETGESGPAADSPESLPTEDDNSDGPEQAEVFGPIRTYEEWAFEEKLASHREWVESRGTTGRQANIGGVDLSGTEMIGVNLRFADMHDANLKGADLLLADLRDACLVRANLDECCLVGTNLEGANLEGASLETSMGLVPRQVAGANLRDASMPEALRGFESLAQFEFASRLATRYFTALTAGCAILWLLIWKTSDAQLLADASIIPFLHSHAAATAAPAKESYLILPVALFTLYLVFQFQLQRLWDATLLLPGVFPDGRRLGEKEPAIVRGLLRAHFRWMAQEASSAGQVEKGAALALAHWMVPFTLLLFWTRYLTVQEMHGSLLHAALFGISSGVAIYVSTKIGRPAEEWKTETGITRRALEIWRSVNPLKAASALVLILLLLTVGVVTGVPREHARAQRYHPGTIRRWASAALWAMGVDPYADLTEANLSPRPANGAASEPTDAPVTNVAGPRLNSVKFRYAQAYRAFFVNAHLWQADFQGAFLSEADFRGADLSQANFRFAILDGASMSHANFDRANLDGAELARTDLRHANMPYASLANATLTDARFDDASLYTANLALATLTRANLEHADLRDALLPVAHMSDADLRGAYLWSAKMPGADMGGAQLGSAILIDADLRGVNLSGAQAGGAVFTNANLSGADLDGADLRGASGLTAYQLCMAKSRYGALLDDALEMQVDAMCGGVRSR